MKVRQLNYIKKDRFPFLTSGGHTYDYQLQAFAAAVRTGASTLTPPADSIANMQVIDNIYRAAGLEPRKGSTD